MISEFLANLKKTLQRHCALSVSFLVALSITLLCCCSDANAQRVRLGDSFVIPNGQVGPPLIRNTSPQLLPPARPVMLPTQQFPQQRFPQQQFPQQQIPQITLPPTINTQPVLPTLQNPFPQQPMGQVPLLPPSQFPNSPAVLGQPRLQQPTFDPFAVQPQSGFPPTMSGQFPGGAPGGFQGGFPGQTQPIQPPPFIYPPPASGPAFPPGGTYSVPQQFPQGGYPGVPGYPGGYPNGNGSWSNSALAWPSQAWARLRSSNVYRLLERPRWRHTYLAPDAFSGSRGLGLNETDIATTLTVPNFLFTAQPLRMSPGFVFHFWDGPDTATTGADLPGQTYSVYLANDFSTPWNRQFGAEANLTVGLYTDFQEVTTDSIRLTGLGLGWYRMNNTTTFKLGVEYLDRIRVKLLPAGGFFIYPTPDLKLDLYFPRPKIAQRLPNLGNYEVWGYIGGEYGGGSWTIKRAAGPGDQVDVNDIRAFVGLEWMGPRQVTGFFEAGYVFDRELIYKSAPSAEIDIDDTFMLRAGLAF